MSQPTIEEILGTFFTQSCEGFIDDPGREAKQAIANHLLSLPELQERRCANCEAVSAPDFSPYSCNECRDYNERSEEIVNAIKEDLGVK